MADKALISELTYRSLESQLLAIPDMPYFVAPTEIEQMLRPTRRATGDHIHVLSLGIIADKESDLRSFLKLMAKRNAVLVSVEEGKAYAVGGNHSAIVRSWKAARRNGAAKIGAKASADKRRAASMTACEIIKDLWPLPSKGNSIKKLEKLSGISRGTIVSILGNRGIAQYNYQAKLKRKARQA